MSVYEVVVALDTAQAKIVELERKLSTQQDDIIVEFHRGTGIAEKLYKEEMEREMENGALQTQKNLVKSQKDDIVREESPH
jgi:hypothetical protein